jgi:hypothetical protein
VAVDRTRRGFRLASPATANVLGIAGLVLFLLSGPLNAMTHFSTLSNAGWSGIGVFYASYGVGWVVARRQPRNSVGWILLGFAVLLAVGGCAGSYAVLIYRYGHGTLPLGPVAVLLNLLWAPALVLLPLAILLFPDGTLPSPRWRWVLGAYLPVAAAALFSPLRRRVQHMVDRRFNRSRYDADRIIAAFAVRLKDAVDLDAVQAALLGAAHQALEPEHVSVWISPPGLP